VPPGTPEGAVPDLIGLSRERATGLVRGAGFRYLVRLEETEDVPDGQVLSQKPGPGEALVAGGTVHLIVARAPPVQGVTVPDVIGKTRDEAETLLRAESFLVRATWGGGSADQVGKVTDQEPRAGATAGRRTWVEIVVAKPGEPVRVPTGGPPPSLPPTGQTEPTDPGDSEGLTRPPAVGEGDVVMPPPTPGGAQPVPPVVLPPRDAPPSAEVPDVTGRPVREAVEAILAADLIPIVETDRTGEAPDGQVHRQSPKGKSMVLPGDLVRIGVRLTAQEQDRNVDLPMALGGLLAKEMAVIRAAGHDVEVVEVAAPGHPYAGTGRVAAQYPVSTVPSSAARTIVLWVVK
jgi:beta-lactam-binding protein with PASTA domain